MNITTNFKPLYAPISPELPEPTPRQLANELEDMAREYGEIGNQLVKIKVKKATELIYIRAREGIRSDKQADRIWDSTPEGIKEIELSFRLKSLEKLMSAIKTKLRVLENESHNQY